MNGPLRFGRVVFAAGGCRCLWQAGFWREIGPELAAPPVAVAGVSAGAAIASLCFAGRMDEGLAHFKWATARNRRNFYPLNALVGRPLFPHEEMYRGALLDVLDEEALARLQEGPELRVLIARPPRWAGAIASVFLAAGCFELESRLRRSVHHRYGQAVGFRPEVISVRSCPDLEALVDLLLESSCTPPITPLLHRNGRPVLDGAVVDSAPVSALDPIPGQTLVLLTKAHPSHAMPRGDGRLYVQPSARVPVAKWDYTNPAGLQAAYDLGRKDGAAFLRSYR